MGAMQRQSSHPFRSIAKNAAVGTMHTVLKLDTS